MKLNELQSLQKLVSEIITQGESYSSRLKKSIKTNYELSDVNDKVNTKINFDTLNLLRNEQRNVKTKIDKFANLSKKLKLAIKEK